jgi:imidazolonepropionase-like amidohydrolase
MATRDAARFLGENGQWGEVAVGQLADLQVIGGDPFASLATLGDRVGVMVRGRWYATAELLSHLQATRQKASP